MITTIDGPGRRGGGGRRWVLRVVGAQASAEREKKEEKESNRGKIKNEKNLCMCR